MDQITKIGELWGKFVWSFGAEFFIETSEGNFVWSDPDYQGDHTLQPFDGDYRHWCKQAQIPFGRDKGTHQIKAYCRSKEGQLPTWKEPRRL